MIGYGLCAVRDRLLECEKAPALRERLAGLKMVVNSVCNGNSSLPLWTEVLIGSNSNLFASLRRY